MSTTESHPNLWQLPTETWDQVISLLPHDDQIATLSVSKLFHDVAIHYLFQKIRICLIPEEDVVEMSCRPNCEYWEEGIAKTPMRSSWEIIHRILADGTFARNVKELCVVAYSAADGIERYVLTDALRALTRLETLHWFGIWPDVTVIASEIPSSVRRLFLQHTSEYPDLSHLTSLIEYQAQIPLPVSRSSRQDDYSKKLDPIDSFSNCIKVVEASSSTLERLHFSPVHLYRNETFTRFFNTLTHLNMLIGSYSSTSGIEVAYRHMSKLQSLSFYGEIYDEILQTLPTESTILPNLTSFRLYSTHTHQLQVPTPTSPIVTFLHQRPNLLQLQLRFPFASWDELLPVFDEIKKMKELEALGYYIGWQELQSYHYAQLASMLPDTLKALSLGIPWAYALSDRDANNLAPLLERLEQLRRLTFFNISFSSVWSPLECDEIANALPQLRMFGLQHEVWSVDQIPGGQPRIKHWSGLKKRFCVESDFPSEDAAWVFMMDRWG
ncbi:hypothetical protein AX16_006249 [Volvariella volvacea WC 439]|nr:hypothetical protein AX16_006249 [Volvariella volvacea WC 439]